MRVALSAIRAQSLAVRYTNPFLAEVSADKSRFDSFGMARVLDDRRRPVAFTTTGLKED
jgi:hypothetical protein